MQEIIFVIDNQGKIKLVNDNLKKLSGKTEEELISEEFISLISTEKRIDAYKKLNQLYNKDNYETIFSLSNNEGEGIDFEVTFNKGIWKNEEVYFCSGRVLKKDSDEILKINEDSFKRLKEYNILKRIRKSLL